MGMRFKVTNTDYPKLESLDTYCEKEAAEYLELIGGSGVDSTTYSLEVVDTISGSVIGLASICYGSRSKSKHLSSLLVTQLELANFAWAA